MPVRPLHPNSDRAFLESVDARGVAVAPGSVGAATPLTNLANHVQPLIRYDLGGRMALRASACACDSHLPVVEVEGRCDDTLRFLRRGRPAVQILPLALCTVLEDAAGLFDFQLVQRGPNELSLSTSACGASAESGLRQTRAVLSAFLAAQGAGKVRIDCHSRRPRRLGRTGKLQRVIGAPQAGSAA